MPAEADIPLFAARPALEPLLGEVAERQRAVLESGRYILGPEVEAFERELAAWIGVEHCVGVANGTEAITIALRSLGIGPGDEVVVPALTFYATAEAVANAGAVPVICDVDPATQLITAEAASAAITKRTAAILPVHLFGNPAPMGELRELADSGGLKLVEDVAQAAGASLDGRRAGALADAGTLSFFPSKNLGGFGDGGAIATSDGEIAAAARRLRAHGSEDKGVHAELGYNSRLDELQAAGLRVLLPHLEEWTAARRRAASRYEEARMAEAVSLPVERPGAAHCYHLYVVRAEDRDGLAAGLAEAGIGSRAYYAVPLHRQPGLARFEPPESLPGADGAATEILALPMGPALSDEQVARVAETVRDAAER